MQYTKSIPNGMLFLIEQYLLSLLSMFEEYRINYMDF